MKATEAEGPRSEENVWSSLSSSSSSLLLLLE